MLQKNKAASSEKLERQCLARCVSVPWGIGWGTNQVTDSSTSSFPTIEILRVERLGFAAQQRFTFREIPRAVDMAQI